MSLQVGFLFIVITLNAYLFWRYYRCLCFCMDSLIWKTEPPSLTNHCAFTLLNMFTFLDMFILHSGMCDLNHYLPHKVCIFNQYLLRLVSVIAFTCWTHLSVVPPSWLFSSWFLFFIVVTVFSLCLSYFQPYLKLLICVVMCELLSVSVYGSTSNNIRLYSFILQSYCMWLWFVSSSFFHCLPFSNRASC